MLRVKRKWCLRVSMRKMFLGIIILWFGDYGGRIINGVINVVNSLFVIVIV